MSGLITTVIVIAGLVGVYFIIKGQPIPFLDDIFKQLGLGIGAGGGKAGGGAGAGGGGGTVSGGNLSATGAQTIFPATGKKWVAKDSGKKERNYASGKASTGTTEWNATGVGATTNIESTLRVNVGNCADSVSIKHYGPTHSDSNCCFHIMDVVCSTGQFTLGGEGPHPTTESTNLGTGGSMGSIKSKEVGIKMVSFKSGSGFTTIGYGDTGSGWKEYIRKSFTEFGAKKKASSPASNAQVQFRTDCSGVKYSVAETAEINPTGTPNLGAGAGAKASPTDTAATADTPSDKKSSSKKSKSNYSTVIWVDNNGMYHEKVGDNYVSYYSNGPGGGYYENNLPYYYQQQDNLHLPDQRLCYI